MTRLQPHDSLAPVAVGKSTLVDTFLRPYRMKEMDRIGEKTWKVKEKEEELLVCENKVTEAKKELERLREKKEYSQCETKSKDIEVLEASMTALQEQISTLKLIDGENRAKLEALRKNIAKLTRDEDEMSRNRNFTEAQKIKEQLEEKVPCNTTTLLSRCRTAVVLHRTAPSHLAGTGEAGAHQAAADAGQKGGYTRCNSRCCAGSRAQDSAD